MSAASSSSPSPSMSYDEKLKLTIKLTEQAKEPPTSILPPRTPAQLAELMANERNFTYSNNKTQLRAYELTIVFSSATRGPLAAYKLNGTTSMLDCATIVCNDPKMEGGNTTNRPVPSDVRFIFGGNVMDHSRCFCSHGGIQTGSTLIYVVKEKNTTGTAAAPASK